ncbi:MAG: PIN domain-containing protein [Planctomycetota bacterium]
MIAAGEMIGPRASVRGVLDASVAARWFIPEQATETTEMLLELVRREEEDPLTRSPFVVPEVFFAEVMSAVTKQCRGAHVLASCASVIADLPMNRVPWAQIPVDRYLEMVGRRVGAYDAIYAAIALEAGLPLITADTGLARALGEPPWVVLIE